MELKLQILKSSICKPFVLQNRTQIVLQKRVFERESEFKEIFYFQRS